MKVGILTQPLRSNYGCLLQAYALQSTLERMGHDVIILNREFEEDKHITFKEIRRKRIYAITRFIGAYKRQLLSKNIRTFTHEHLHHSKAILTSSKLKEISELTGFDGYVVGSDQVWRPNYSPNILDYFLSFTKGKSVKRIAYAASLGVSNWEFTEEETQICKELVHDFDAVSVRESSAIELLKNHFGIDSSLVLDPTLLLEKEHYGMLIPQDDKIEKTGEMFCYVLDNSPQMSKVIDFFEKSSGYKSYYCMPRLSPSFLNLLCHYSKCTFPSVYNWLKSFISAKMVITDSFHGTVFSIIFNKPFWVIGNTYRGMARFQSLLSLFNLEHRLLHPNEIDNVNWKEPIDWEEVNRIKREWQKKSLDFLKDNL